jgi:hypothetical protein
LDQCLLLAKSGPAALFVLDHGPIDFLAKIENKESHNKISPGAYNARDFARGDCGRCIQHSDAQISRRWSETSRELMLADERSNLV